MRAFRLALEAGVPMKRAVVRATFVAGMLALALTQADVPLSGQALAREQVSPSARLAQSYYLPPTRPTPAAPTPVGPLRQMTPFPIVRIVGAATRRGARIRVLSVRAPAGTTILVRCRRQRCSRRSRAGGRGMSRPVRFRRFERSLRAGTILEVFVGRPDAIGKFTRFRIRRSRRPSRTDLCLFPGARTGSACPE